MTKVICELGINHFGSKKITEKLISGAFKAGAWGIKFQYRNLNNHFKFSRKNGEIGKEIIDKELRKNYLKPHEIISLSRLSKKIGLKVGISFFHTNDIKDFNNFEFDFYKILFASLTWQLEVSID